MKELIPMDEYGVFASSKFEVMVDSRLVAEVFEKEHKDVIKAIRKVISPESGYSEEFGRRNFAPSSYKNSQNKTQPCYHMTRDGFVALAMGFTGKKASQFKEAYIRRFNEMEAMIFQIQTLRDQHPFLTDAIKDTHEDAKPYHYSNEADMLNRIVVGMTAKAYREEHGIPKSEPIRPHFNPDEAALMEYLQHIDAGFVFSIPDFQQRKQKLEWCAMNWRRKRHPELIEKAAG